ncbi:MAG: UrcA family protein [Brevundimonas sp.]
MLLAIAAPDGAQSQATRPVEEAETVIVSYADLDLNQPAGSRILEHRLRVAARRTCSDANLPMSHYLVRHACIKATLEDGWAQVAAHRSARSVESRTVTLAALRAQAQP